MVPIITNQRHNVVDDHVLTAYKSGNFTQLTQVEVISLQKQANIASDLARDHPNGDT